MKKILAFVLAITPTFLFAQNAEGKIIFSEEVKFEINLPEGMEHMKDKLPSSQKSQKELLFNATTSLWKSLEVEENEAAETLEDTNEGANFRFKMITSEGEDSELYRDIAAGKKIEKTDFMGKVFLINGSVETYPWKLTDERKTIAGYDCQKAIVQDTTQKVEAWFTSAIPVATGPSHYSALPGMILAVSIDDGRQTITATEVELMKLDKDAIRAPKKGKKVSQEAFDKIVADKMKEMEEGAGENVMRIRIGQ